MDITARPTRDADSALRVGSGTNVDPCDREDAVSQGREQNVSPALQSTYSDHASIERLPPEIMECIFLLCQPFYDTFPSTWPERTSLQWMSVAWVCARWRAIATAYPTLWSTIELCYARPADVARTFLERSRNAPLTIFFISTYQNFFPNDIDVLQEVGLHHSARLVTVHLILGRWRHFTNCWVLLNAQALRPKSLSVLLSLDEATVPQNPEINPDIFAAQLCHVRELTVGSCTGLQLGFFSGLTHLSVHDVSPSAYYVDEFWNLLQRSPQLEELVLVEWDIVDWDISGRPTISLSHLRRLLLLDVPQSSSFLMRLDIPDMRDMWVSPGY